MARVYDFETKTVTEIPDDELAPGMLRAKVEGVDGEVFVDTDQLHRAQIRHAGLELELALALDVIHQVIGGVYCPDLEEWLDGFRHDTNPAKEMAVWSKIAAAYMHFVRPTMKQEKKRELLQILLSAVNNGPDPAIVTKTVALKHWSRSEVALMLSGLVKGVTKWEQEEMARRYRRRCEEWGANTPES